MGSKSNAADENDHQLKLLEEKVEFLTRKLKKQKQKNMALKK